MMIIILGILAYFIIGGIVLGIVTKINDDLKDDQDYVSLYNIDYKDNIGNIGLFWPITVPLLIGISTITIVDALINIIAGLFIKNKNTNLYIERKKHIC